MGELKKIKLKKEDGVILVGTHQHRNVSWPRDSGG